MALPNASVVRKSNPQASPIEGNDNYSGLVFYGNVATTGLTALSNKRLLRSPLDAENIGIDYSYSDETKATATITFVNVGVNNDALVISNTDFSGTVSLGSYTKTAAITTLTQAASSLAADINANTYRHGFTATSSVAVVTVTAAKGKGIALNGLTTLIKTVQTGSIDATLSTFAGGVSSVKAVWKYHIDMVFNKNPNAYLHIGVYPVPSVNNFNEVENLVLFYNGQIKKIGVFAEHINTIAKSDLEALQTVVNRCRDVDSPVSCIYTANLKAVTDLNTLLNLNTVNAESVMVVISGDASPQSKGFELHNTSSKSVSDLGAFIGMKSKGKVNNAISNVSLFNFSDGVNNESLMFSNGQLYQNTAISQLGLLDDYRYVFLRKFNATNRLTGSYANRDSNATNVSNEYNRGFMIDVYNKASRILREVYLEALSADIFLNADGTLQEWQIQSLQALGNDGLANMVNAGEISAADVLIDPTQNIRANNKLKVKARLVRNGVAEDIEIELGYVTSI
jgi:hypothetical protein